MGRVQLERAPPAQHLHAGALPGHGEKIFNRDSPVIREEARRHHVRTELPLVGELEGVHEQAPVNQGLKSIPRGRQAKPDRRRRGGPKLPVPLLRALEGPRHQRGDAEARPPVGVWQQ